MTGAVVFNKVAEKIEAWPLWIGKLVGTVYAQPDYQRSVMLDHSKIWITQRDSSIHGWDFGVSGLPPVLLSSAPSKAPGLKFGLNPLQIIDKVSGRKVFQLSGMYAGATLAQLDKQYLIFPYGTEEIVVIKLQPLLLQQQSVVYRY